MQEISTRPVRNAPLHRLFARGRARFVFVQDLRDGIGAHGLDEMPIEAGFVRSRHVLALPPAAQRNQRDVATGIS